MLPGPNIVNLALMFGDRFFGWRGALAALGGMLAVPLVIVLVLAALYAEFARIAVVAGALRGMGAVAAGLVIATAVKLAPTLRRNRARPWPLACAFALATLRWRSAGCAGRWSGWCWASASSAAHGLVSRWRRKDRRDDRRVLQPARAGLADLLGLFGHFLVLSLLAVGGAITTAPDMHRYVVVEHGWISDAQFTASIAHRAGRARPERAVRRACSAGTSPGRSARWRRWSASCCRRPALTFVVGALRRHTRQDARRARLHHRPDAADDRPAARHRLAAHAAIARHPMALLLVPATIVFMMKTQRSPLWMIAVGAIVGALGGA